jgi:hypothetical protein
LDELDVAFAAMVVAGDWPPSRGGFEKVVSSVGLTRGLM